MIDPKSGGKGARFCASNDARAGEVPFSRGIPAMISYDSFIQCAMAGRNLFTGGHATHL